MEKYGFTFNDFRMLSAALSTISAERDSLRGELQEVKAELGSLITERTSLLALLEASRADLEAKKANPEVGAQLDAGPAIHQALLTIESQRKAVEKDFEERTNAIEKAAYDMCALLKVRMEAANALLESEQAKTRSLEARNARLNSELSKRKEQFSDPTREDMQRELERLKKIAEERAEALRMFEAREALKAIRNDLKFEEWSERIKGSPRFVSTLATGPDGINAYAVLASNGCVYFPGVAAASELGLPATHDVTNTGQFWTENLDKAEGFRLGSKQ